MATRHDDPRGPRIDDSPRRRDSPELKRRSSDYKPVPTPPILRRTSSSRAPEPEPDPRPSSPSTRKSPIGETILEKKEDEPKPKSRATSVKPETEPAADESPKDPELDIIDMETFGQILEMDDDPDDREFSTSIIENFFEQAGITFDDMDKALASRDLSKLSALGHFLKGSSAALGVKHVQSSCEKMQNYGKLWDGASQVKLTEKDALEKIETLLEKLKVQYVQAEKWLKDNYLSGE